MVVQECPGFLVNRLLMPYLNEATYCLQEGAASATEIDAAMVGFGMPMGPFTLMDMLGIDVCQYVGDYLYSEYGPRMEPAPALRQAGGGRPAGREERQGLLRLRRRDRRAGAKQIIAAYRPTVPTASSASSG